MKILFLYPNTNSQIGFHYGISHMSAVLKKAGHTVGLWQLCEQIAPLPTEVEFKKKLQEDRPDIIGISVVTNQWPYAKTLAGWAKAVTDVPIVCGGVHTMASAQEILSTSAFDYIIRGEAENSFLEFVNAFAANRDLSNVPALGWYENGKVRLNPLAPLPDLKALPFKDYEIFDFQKLIDAKDGWVGLMASRGCPFSCTYCFNHQMVAQYRKDLNCGFKQLNYIRHFDIRQIIKEIQYLIENYTGINMFIFDDDLFTFYRDYVIEFCDAYKKMCNVPFTVNAHVGAFDTQRAEHLAAANCKIVKFGVESGSEKIRKQILGRHMKNRQIIEAIQIAKLQGLHTSTFIMLGLPNETHDDLMDTIKLLATSLPGRFRWTFFYPFPGTQAFELSRKFMDIDYERMASLENFTDASCLDFGPEHNLLLKKVGRMFPWFVNAYSDLPVAEFYQRKIDEIVAMDHETYAAVADDLYAEDKRISADFVRQGLSHYAIKYNSFMGVISDYFTREK